MGFRARHIEPLAGQTVANGRDVRDGAKFVFDEGVADREGNVEAVDGELRCAVEGHRSQVFVGVFELGEFKPVEANLETEQLALIVPALVRFEDSVRFLKLWQPVFEMRNPVLDVQQLLAVVVVVQPVGAGEQGQVLDLVLQLDLFQRKRVAGSLGLGQTQTSEDSTASRRQCPRSFGPSARRI